MAELGPLTCAGCGLLCDDVIVEHSGDGAQLRPACALGAEWFAARAQRPPNDPLATIDGQPADLDMALARAAELLRAARRPLVHGFDAATVEDVRAAVVLADRVGALVAIDGLGDPWPGVPALALRGASTATLGEIRDRSRVLVVWREDPESTHPRLLDRLGFGSDSRSRLHGERTLVVVDNRDTATGRRADLRVRWPQERDLEALTSLHVMHRRLTVRASEIESELGGLLDQIDTGPHVAFVHGPGLGAGTGGQRRVLALYELVRELSHDRHVVTLALPAAPGRRGAQDVLAWQTGYADHIDLASGHPELITAAPSLHSAEGVDLSLSIESVPEGLVDGVARIALCSLPVEGVEVSIRTAAPGVGAAGTAHRLDGIPLTLQAPQPSDAPTAAALLARLLEEVEVDCGGRAVTEEIER